MIFPNPDMGMIVERLPSTQVPYGLRGTLGYFAANKPLLHLYIMIQLFPLVSFNKALGCPCN